MALNSFTFRFRVRLPASADRAYRWATDFRSDDLALMGEKGRRTVEKLSRDIVVLTDTVPQDGRTVRKVRLVRLLPQRRMWTNTHLAGPAEHSQFLYEITPAGRRASRLTFTGLQVVRTDRPMTARQLSLRAKEVARADRQTWDDLARAMKRDIA